MFSTTERIIRIGIITSSYPLSSDDTINAGVFIRDLAKELVRNGHEVHVLTPHKHGRVEPSESMTVMQIPWWGGAKDLASLSMRNPLNLLQFSTLVMSGLWNVPRYADGHHLDALLAMWAIPSGLFSWWAWRRLGIPYGVWALGSDIWARKNYPLGDFVVRTVLRDAKFRFADGIKLANDVAKLAGGPCEFVPSMRRLPMTNDLVDADFPPDICHFLFIGRYEVNKGPDILIEAMVKLLSSGYKAHLHMFGKGSLETNLRQSVKGFEQYIHIGGYADPQTVMTYMRACDWLVIPSRIESIPLIFVDAMQMELPVIVTDVGDLGDLVRRFSVGRIVSVPEPQELSMVLKDALIFTRMEFQARYKDALEIFDIGQSARRCAEFLTFAAKV